MDFIDTKILKALQQDAGLSQRELADRVNLSQNACWRRVTRLYDQGVITGKTVRVNAAALGLNLTVFVMIRIRTHSVDWLDRFRRSILSIENVIDFYRVAGDYDYMLKVVAADMNDFDRVYQRIIADQELDAVTSHITMEAIADNRDLPAY